MIIESGIISGSGLEDLSFKYLEQLTEDYDFSLEGKNLGGVKVLRKKLN